MSGYALGHAIVGGTSVLPASSKKLAGLTLLVATTTKSFGCVKVRDWRVQHTPLPPNHHQRLFTAPFSIFHGDAARATAT